MNFYESPRLVVVLIRITMINIERIDSFPILKHVIHTYNEFVHLFGSFKFPLTMTGHRDFVTLLLDLFLIIIWGCHYEKCHDRLKFFSQFLLYLNKIHTSEALLSKTRCRTFWGNLEVFSSLFIFLKKGPHVVNILDPVKLRPIFFLSDCGVLALFPQSPKILVHKV